MTNLGKTVFALLISVNLFADVTAEVDKSVVTPGDIVNFSLHVSDRGFEKPDISSLCGTNVLGRSSQTSINGINGTFTKMQTLIYSFAPEKSCVIEPMEVKTDSGVVKTKPIKIEVRPLSAEAKAKFSLSFISDKKEVYTGEPFKVTLISKVRRDMQIVDSKFEPSDMNGFWIKKQQQDDGSYEGDYVQTKVTYIVAAQRDGNLTINPAKMSLAQRAAGGNEMWGPIMPNIKWSRYLSNALHVKVKPLPNGVDLVGDMNISMDVEKTKVSSNEPVNATITLRGVGNFEDVGSIKPFIPNVSVFEDDAKIENLIKNGSYGSVYTKKIAFISDGNFTIPAVAIKYFDTKTDRIKVIKTEPVPIEVTGAAAAKKADEPLTMQKPSAEPKNETAKSDGNVSYLYLIISLFAGFVLGIVVMLLKPILKKRKTTLQISSNDTKAILLRLMEFKEDAEVKEMIEILEKKLYTGEEVKVDKSKLKELRKRYKF